VDRVNQTRPPENSASVDEKRSRSFRKTATLPAVQRVIVLYSGRVQGVGFRATVRHVARGYDVTGTVRNLPDGRVELVAEGMKAELKAFLAGIANGELSSHIAESPETWSASCGRFHGFVIA
jgi:acylphosphatase